MFKKSALEKIIEDDSYAFIDSTSDKLNLSEDMNHKRYSMLGTILTNQGFPNRSVLGSYHGKITKSSYLVLKPKNMDLITFRRTIFTLGKQFDQESVILSSKKKVDLIYVTGPNAGRAYSGEGYATTVAKVDKNFSIINCDDYEQLILGEYNLNKNSLSEIYDEFQDLII